MRVEEQLKKCFEVEVEVEEIGVNELMRREVCKRKYGREVKELLK